MTKHVLIIFDPVHPGRPPLTMNEWRNAHWSVKSAAKQKIAWQVTKALQDAKIRTSSNPLFERIGVRIVQFAPDRRVRDNDGLSAFRKDVLDALKTRRIVLDDSTKYVVDGGNEIETDRALPRIEIHITEEPRP